MSNLTTNYLNSTPHIYNWPMQFALHMKRSLSGLDLIPLVKELQSLIGGRVDKIYQPENDELAISISMKNREKVRLHVRITGWIFLTKTPREMPATPTSFAMLLRKNIGNSVISDISQHGCDRIIELILKKESEYKLIFEIFGEGNILLVSGEDIIAPMKMRKWKHRELRARSKYVSPPHTFDPREMDNEKFSSLIRASKADIVRTLATRLNLGGGYAEEICIRADIKKEEPASEADDEILDKIREAIKGLVDDLEGTLSPNISLEKGEPVDVSPIELSIDRDRNIKGFGSFSEAIEAYLASLPKLDPEEAKISDERQRIERTLSSQETAIEGFKEEIDRAQEQAEFIFSNYEKIEKSIEDAKIAQRSGSVNDNIKILDPAKGLFSVRIDEEELVLNWKRGVTENAQRFYEEVKKHKNKLEGALVAIVETKKDIEKLEDEHLILKVQKQEKREKSRPDWFERFRWFISSEDVLVIAGKDAKSNEEVVKKHLKPGDRYVHAEIHGAPSVVVKTKEGMTEATLREAGIFSLAMSKAWNSGITAGSAYWVTPEQVSKTAESGEFIPRGAFVIRGKRNYFEKIDIKLGMGICTISSRRKMMCGPVSATMKNCDSMIEIEPGDMVKEQAAKELARRFNWSISEIQSILPPGNLRILSKKQD